MRTIPGPESPLFPMLPLIYVAWADLELTPDELEAVCQAADVPASEDWLDPANPPTARELAGVLTAIRTHARTLAPETWATITSVGAALAQDPVSLEALERVEEILGIHDFAELAPVVERPDWERPAPIEGLQALLDGPHAELRERVRGMLQDPEFAYREYSRADYREQVLHWLRILAGEGLTGLAYPGVTPDVEDLGPFLAVFETLAVYDLNLVVKLGVQNGLFGGSLMFLGTERHRALLPRVAELSMTGCFAMTETGHGSNVRALQTRATWLPEQDGFELHTPDIGAQKDYIGNAARHARWATVFARLHVGDDEHGVHALLVQIRDTGGQPMPGVTITDCGPKLGLNGVDNGRLRFERVFVPRDALLDRFATVSRDGVYDSPIVSPARRFFTMLGTLVGGRVSIANASVSVAKSSLTIAIRYAEQRRQFGPEGGEITLLDYRTHQKRLLPRLARTVALDLACEALSARYVAELWEEDKRQLEAEAAGLKALASWHATDCAQIAREACGGVGYLWENRLADIKANSEIFTTFEGDNTVLMLLVARGRISDFQARFEDQRVMGALRYAAERMGAALSRIDPIESRRTDDLRDPSVQQAMMRFRDEDLLASLLRRIQKRTRAGMEPGMAFAECGNHALDLARAHVERQVLDELVRREAELQGHLKEVIATIRSLYALSALEADLGWFLENGYLERARSRAIREEVEALCTELRPNAAAVVESFGIPDSVLGANIA